MTWLTATPGVAQVALTWAPSTENAAQGYNILRSTASGGPFASIASWTDNTNPKYIDTTATNGTTYYYVVAAINQAGTSSNSTEASATPTDAGSLPTGWTNQDIGVTATTGHASYAKVNQGTFIASASGSRIGGSSDGFNYTYTRATGDFTLTAHLGKVAWNKGGGSQKVGIMMRETLDANSAALVMTVGDVGAREAKFGIRSSNGVPMTWVGGNDYSVPPGWFRLQRSGNTFTAFESSDGQSWFQVGSGSVAMANTYYVGLAVCSNGQAINTTTFDHVQ